MNVNVPIPNTQIDILHFIITQGEAGASGVISGMRGDCDVRIYVDLASAVADGFAFFESANGVVLCAGDKRGLLPPRYFRRAVHKKRGRTEQGARVDLSGWRMNLAHLFLGIMAKCGPK